jgi:hypothetical protein
MSKVIENRKGLFFLDYLQSFGLGSPDMVEAWKHKIQDEENKTNDVICFVVPKKRSGECILSIEKLLKDKLT